MKCCYHPENDSQGTCVYCNVPLCKNCLTNTELNEGLCEVCLRQKKFYRFYSFFRVAICSIGIGWIVIALLVFKTGNWGLTLTYGMLGLLVAFGINAIALVVINRMLMSNLKPYQKVFVALSRYSVTGNKVFLNQAINSLKKVDDITPYKDALFDQLVSVLILQPYDLPLDWIEYLSENFKLTEKELLEGILEYGTDVFEENIFNQHFYQAIEPFIEILKRANDKKLYNKLIDKILLRLQSVDLKAITRSQALSIPGVQQPAQKESPTVLRDRAFLTELKLIDAELEEFLITNKRVKDWDTISSVIEQFELPKVPKSTFEAAKLMASQSQQQMAGPDKIVGTKDDIGDPNKVKICAECGITFHRDELMSYVFQGISVNVCNDCQRILENEGHREPRLLAEIKKPKEYRKLVEKKDENE